MSNGDCRRWGSGVLQPSNSVTVFTVEDPIAADPIEEFLTDTQLSEIEDAIIRELDESMLVPTQPAPYAPLFQEAIYRSGIIIVPDSEEENGDTLIVVSSSDSEGSLNEEQEEEFMEDEEDNNISDDPNRPVFEPSPGY